MGLFEDFKRFYEDEQNSVEVPTINVYDPDYIKERIRVIKSNPIRNRFRWLMSKSLFRKSRKLILKNTDLENMQQTITRMGKTILLFFIFISTHMKNIIMKVQILLWKMQRGLPEVYFSNGSGVMIATSTTM